VNVVFLVVNHFTKQLYICLM